jgi:hypothetical protein
MGAEPPGQEGTPMENVRTNPLTRRFAAMLMATLFAGVVLAGSVAGGSAQDDRAVKGADQHSTQLAGGNKPKYTNP